MTISLYSLFRLFVLNFYPTHIDQKYSENGKQNIVKELQKSKEIIDNNLVPQMKMSQTLYGVSASDLPNVNNSEMMKQLQTKEGVLKHIRYIFTLFTLMHIYSKTIDDNIKQVDSCDTKNYELAIAKEMDLTEIFSQNKEAKKSAEEIKASGLPDLKAVGVKKK
jgi:hypothetical protein